MSTRDTNRDKAITGAACLLGAISGGLGVTHGIDLATAAASTTQAALLGWLAQHSWGYGYWGPFLLDLKDTEPGCGLEEFNRLVGEYSFVTNLYSTYGHDVSTGAYTSTDPDHRPEVESPEKIDPLYRFCFS